MMSRIMQQIAKHMAPRLIQSLINAGLLIANRKVSLGFHCLSEFCKHLAVSFIHFVYTFEYVPGAHKSREG
jgi:hypothetical protein